jgi:hypothetical protein
VLDDAAAIDDLLATFHAPVDAGRWVEQFSREERPVLLRTVRRWIESYYWGPARVEAVLDAVLADVGAERVAVAPLQPTASTQACLNKLFVKRVRAHGMSTPRIAADADVHVYLDDVTCTGRTLDRHLRRYLPRVRPGSSVLVFHLVEHTHDVKQRRAALASVATEHGVTLRTDHALAIENRPETLGGLEVLTPAPSSRSALHPTYTARIGSGAFRAPDLFGDGPLFADADERDVVERALLRVGSWIAAQDKRVRPLGAGEGPSLGFGATSFTFHDVPLTVPPALWWSSDDWFPLVSSR